MKKIIIPVVLLGALTFAVSCKKGIEPGEPRNPAEKTAEKDTLIEIKTFLAKEYGAKISEIYFDKPRDRFIVQGDIGVDKNNAELLFKESSKIPKLSSDKNSKLPAISQRKGPFTYSPSSYPEIRVKNNCTSPDWKAAATAAINNFNHSFVKTISNVRMVEVTSGTVHCTISETGGTDPTGNSYLAVGAGPSSAAPGSYVTIYTHGNSRTLEQKKLIVTHELGHILGFKHTGDTTPGSTFAIGSLPADDPYSFIRPGSDWDTGFNGFSSLDLQAMNIMFPRTPAGWGEKLNITGINLAGGNNSFLYLTSNTLYPDGNRLFIRWNFNNNSWLLMSPGRKGVKMALTSNGQYYFITADKKIYKDAYPDPILMPGEAIDIAANDVGELYIVSNTVMNSEGNVIMKWDGWSSWVQYSTYHSAKAIALGPGYNAAPVTINNSGHVSVFTSGSPTTSGYTDVEATSIAVCNSKLDISGHPIIYITDKKNVVGTTNYPIKRLTNNTWYTTNFSGIALAVDHEGHPWTLVSGTGQVYSHPTF